MKSCGMRLNKKMKGAIFDMDGLLFDTETIWHKYWTLAATDRDIELPESFKYEICGSNGEDMYNKIRKYYKTDDPYSLYDETHNNYENELKQHIEMKKGVIEILEYLKAHDYKIAIASSSDRERIISNITRTNIKDYFDELVGHEDVTLSKPNPEVFLKAANYLGFKPEECYVFEDAYNGIVAAYEAGCKAIMIPDIMAPNEEMKSKCTVYNSLLDVIKDIEI